MKVIDLKLKINAPWKRLLSLPIGVCFSLTLLLTSSVQYVPTTNCDQKFTFFFKLQYDDVFWIGEDLFGECGQSNLIQVFLRGDKPSGKKIELDQFERWEWIDHAKKAMKTEVCYPLKLDSKQEIDDEVLGIKLRSPKHNNRAMNQFEEEFAENCARQWNQKMKTDGIDEPIVDWDTELELAYYHADGLYFNYQIEKAFVFPESSYLLIMTKQAQRCAGGDTMDGFMIFKFKSLKK
ncbi:MAG: hypothetical protein EAZ08_01335 [Cytophagales bacterium]|nr:MAG: hypothetical protein EAZ08_01335 [Cytophagales bacterium]